MKKNIKGLNVVTGRFLLLMLLFTTLLNGGTEKVTAPPLEEIEKFLPTWMKAGKIPGLILVIIRADSPDYIKGFGYADLESQSPVTPDTLFELGSCSKAFTALAALLLEEKGLINLDSPVSDYLPWFYVTYQNQRPTITIRQLLHHTSGIPWESFSRIPRASGDLALRKTIRKLVGIRLNHMPGERFEYATVNYDIVGIIIEKIMEKSFEEFMENNLFPALGLSAALVGVEQKEQIPKMATGYKRAFFKPRKYTPPVLRGNNPAAYIISNGKDIARWLKIQMGLVETDFDHLIQKSHQPDKTVNPTQNLTSYGMGWFVNQFRDELIFHGGLNPNFTAYLAFHPRKKIGVAVLANTDGNYTSFIGRTALGLLTHREAPQRYPSEDKIDIFCSIISFVLGLYVLWMAVLVIIRIIGFFQGKNRYAPLTWKKVLRIILALLGSLPFLVGIYLIPRALAHLNWETALLWLPFSFKVMMILLLSCLAASYIYYILTMVIPHRSKYRNEIPLITVLSVLTGLSHTAVLFIVTTAFFSTVAVGYLLYYFGILCLMNVGGRKIVQAKMIKIINNIALDLRIDLINKIFSTRYQEFEKMQDGRIFATLNQDTGVLAGSAGLIIGFITSVVTIISGFIYMTTISVTSTLVVLISVTFLILYYRVVAKKSRVYMEDARDSVNVYMGLLNSLIGGYKELCIHRRKKYEFREDLVSSTRENCVKSIMASIKFLNANLIGDSIFMIILGILSIVISRLVQGVSIVTLISFVLVILYLLGPIRLVLNAIPRLTGIRVAWDRIKGFVTDLDVAGEGDPVKEFIKNLDRVKKEDIINFEEIRHLPRHVQNFKVEGLSYQYELNDENGEKGFAVGPIDLEVNRGEILFIIGGNGSGKTTLAKLITGLYRPDEGIVKVNGKPLDISKVGEFFSTIYSNYHLFTKLYSVDFNKKRYDIREYLKLLLLDKKVAVKNGQYTTLNLSGGQRKRLALFQCYMEDRPIYLFDELAANQDPEFRKFFYRELLVNMKKQGKIVIAITHDDHYFDVADKVIKLDMGKVDKIVKGKDYNLSAEIGITTRETRIEGKN
jgi:putative ATP-binding cassette transporter